MRHNEGRDNRPQAVLKAERSALAANEKVREALVERYLAKAWLAHVEQAYDAAQQEAHEFMLKLPY